MWHSINKSYKQVDYLGVFYFLFFIYFVISPSFCSSSRFEKEMSLWGPFLSSVNGERARQSDRRYWHLSSNGKALNQGEKKTNKQMDKWIHKLLLWVTKYFILFYSISWWTLWNNFWHLLIIVSCLPQVLGTTRLRQPKKSQLKTVVSESNETAKKLHYKSK